MTDCVVIGAGIAGSVIARELAERGGLRVSVLEKRGHIGGNCYDAPDEYGVLVHLYGPHIFHTELSHVYAYLSRFTRWHAFEHKVAARVGDRLLPVPFNLNALHMVYDGEKAARLEAKLRALFGDGARVPILKLRAVQDPELVALADYVYETVFLRYTMKQWGQTPEEISPEVTGRVPIVISRDDRYFHDPWQGVPLEGYARLFEALLTHPNITVQLNTDAKARLRLTEGGVTLDDASFDRPVIYTGPVDELLDSRFGPLPYRSLDFAFEHYDMPDYQGRAVVNYTVSEPFTRITEFKHLTGQHAPGTTIAKEYPRAYTGAPGQLPYYAIMNSENEALYARYVRALAPYKNLHLLGRLAEYKYYNIDAMVDKALRLAHTLL